MVKFVHIIAPDMSLPPEERQREIDGYMERRANYYRQYREELIARKMEKAAKKFSSETTVRKAMELDGIDIQCKECRAWRSLDIETEVANLPELWTCSHGNFKCGSVAEIAPISEADVQRILDAYQSKASESNEEPFAKKQKRNAETPAQEVSVAAVEAETANISSSDGFDELAVEKVVSKGSSTQEEPPWSVCDRFPCGSLVLVKFGARPLWPALVEMDPNYLCHFATNVHNNCVPGTFDEDLKDNQGNDVTNEEKDSGEKKSNGGVAEREDDLGELIIAPLAYHVSLMGDPVERIWIGVNYISPYSQKQAMLDRECSFSNEVSVQMLQLHTMAIKMAELVKKYPRSKRVELAGYMTRYKGQAKVEPKWEEEDLLEEQESPVVQSSSHNDEDTDEQNSGEKEEKFPTYLHMSDEDEQMARFDTERYLLGDYYFAPMGNLVPKLDQKGVEKLRELGIKMEPEPF